MKKLSNYNCFTSISCNTFLLKDNYTVSRLCDVAEKTHTNI